MEIACSLDHALYCMTIANKLAAQCDPRGRPRRSTPRCRWPIRNAADTDCVAGTAEQEIGPELAGIEGWRL